MASPTKALAPHVDLRTLIVDAAGDEFREVGYFSTDIKRISLRAGVEVITFHSQFVGKQSVLIEVYRQWIECERRLLIDAAQRSPSLTHSLVVLMLNAVVAHHQRWWRLRQAWILLSSKIPAIAEARRASWNRQVDTALQLYGSESRHCGRVIFSAMVLQIEAVADLVASGDAAALDLRESDLVASLARAMLALAGNAADAIDSEPLPAGCTHTDAATAIADFKGRVQE